MKLSYWLHYCCSHEIVMVWNLALVNWKGGKVATCQCVYNWAQKVNSGQSI